MFIHLAETGQKFELSHYYSGTELRHIHAGTEVREVQTLLEDLTGIAKDDQVLFAGSDHMRPDRTLGAYGLPSMQVGNGDGDHPKVILFNKLMLVQGSPPPGPEVLRGDFRVKFPAELASSSPRTLREQLDMHLIKGQAIFAASQAKLKVCRELDSQVKVQCMALEAAQDNMQRVHAATTKRWEDFIAEFQHQARQQGDILGTLEPDIKKLAACTLHPALQSGAMRSLADCIDERAWRKQLQDGAAAHNELCNEVTSRHNAYLERKLQAEDFLKEQQGVSLKNELAKAAAVMVDQDSFLESIRLSPTAEASASARELSHKCERQHKTHLPRMMELDREMAGILDVCLKGKNEMNQLLHSRMQTISRLQKWIREVQSWQGGLEDELKELWENIETLKAAPRRVGTSYKSCLAEVVRRKQGRQLYMGLAGQMINTIASKRKREMQRRENFNYDHSGHLPHDLLSKMGLFDMPSNMTVDIPPFDANLLDLEVKDIEQYAPRYLLGSLVMNRDDGWNSEVDEYNIDEIAGTSKLEFENVRLKSQLASAISIISSVDAEFRPDDSRLGDEEDSEFKVLVGDPLQKTIEALQAKDEHALELQKIVAAKYSQCGAYEQRIRELEDRLREQCSGGELEERLMKEQYESRIRELEVKLREMEQKLTMLTVAPEVDTMVTNEDQAASGISDADGRGSVADPMDGVSSSATPAGDGETSGNVVAEEARTNSVEEKLIMKDGQIKYLLMEVFRLAENVRQCQLNSADLEKRLHEERRSNHGTKQLQSLQSEVASSTGGFPGLVKRLRETSPKSPAVEEQMVTELAQTLANKLEEVVTELSKDKDEVIKNLFAKCKMEKQVSREKVCLSRFEVHQLALFLPNSSGHYEALNRNCPNYYLSDESIALFDDHRQQSQQRCILGQIVHIEHYVALWGNGTSPEDGGDLRSSFPTMTGRPRHNPYGLPPGTHFFVVTVAMVPGLH